MAPAYLTVADADIAAMADVVARHAVPLLLAGSALALVLAGLAWRTIERHAPAVLPLAARLWGRVDRRGIVARLLGLEAALAFVVAAGGTMAFVEIADAIDPDEGLARFDVALAAALARHVSAGALAVFARLTHLGDFEFLSALVVLAAVVLALRRERLMAGALVVVAGGASALNQLLKLLFGRERPPFDHALVQVHSSSFPSGHAAGSLAVYGMLAYLAVRLLPRPWRLPVASIATLLVVGVGSSRVLLQVHYLSDVLAGWLGASVWTALCIAALESLRRRRHG